MTDLFKTTTLPEMTKCDCIKVKDKPAPTVDQKTVILSRSIDPNILVGSCSRCKKVHTKRIQK